MSPPEEDCNPLTAKSAVTDNSAATQSINKTLGQPNGILLASTRNYKQQPKPVRAEIPVSSYRHRFDEVV